MKLGDVRLHVRVDRLAVGRLLVLNSQVGELAQLLREDFLLKFNNYAGRVDTEMNLVPDEFWIEMPADETNKLEDATR